MKSSLAIEQLESRLVLASNFQYYPTPPLGFTAYPQSDLFSIVDERTTVVAYSPPLLGLTAEGFETYAHNIHSVKSQGRNVAITSSVSSHYLEYASRHQEGAINGTVLRGTALLEVVQEHISDVGSHNPQGGTGTASVNSIFRFRGEPGSAPSGTLVITYQLRQEGSYIESGITVQRSLAGYWFSTIHQTVLPSGTGRLVIPISGLIEGEVFVFSAGTGVYSDKPSPDYIGGSSGRLDIDWEILTTPPSNPPVSADLISVNFSGSGKHELIADPNDVNSFTGPEWLDVDHDGIHDWPVSSPYYQHVPLLYSAGGRITVDVTLKLDEAYYGEVLVRGDGPEQYDFAPTIATLENGYITITGISSIASFSQSVNFFDNFAIDWYVQGEDGVETKAGTSHNVLYVSLGTPSAGVPLFHTVVDIAVRSAKGATSPTAIVDKIWEEFSDLSVSRIDGAKMYYYGTLGSTAPGPDGDAYSSLKTLLATADGRCGAWARLFEAALKVHRLEDTYQDIAILTLVPPLPGGQTLPPLMAVKESLKGQGNLTPLIRHFGNHAVVRVAGKVYDPSYGTQYNSEAILRSSEREGFVQKSLEAFYVPVPKIVRSSLGIPVRQEVHLLRPLRPGDVIHVASGS